MKGFCRPPPFEASALSSRSSRGMCHACVTPTRREPVVGHRRHGDDPTRGGGGALGTVNPFTTNGPAAESRCPILRRIRPIIATAPSYLRKLLKSFDQHERARGPRHGPIDHPTLVRRNPDGRSAATRHARSVIELVHQCRRAERGALEIASLRQDEDVAPAEILVDGPAPSQVCQSYMLLKSKSAKPVKSEADAGDVLIAGVENYAIGYLEGYGFVMGKVAIPSGVAPALERHCRAYPRDSIRMAVASLAAEMLVGK